MNIDLILLTLDHYLDLSFSRSSGKGGQNVNKVSTKVTASIKVDVLEGLDAAERSLLESRLANRISKEGFLAVTVQDTRSQLRNRDIAKTRLAAVIFGALKKTKKRVGTKPNRAAKERRLAGKRFAGLKKDTRRRPGTDD